VSRDSRLDLRRDPRVIVSKRCARENVFQSRSVVRRRRREINRIEPVIFPVSRSSRVVSRTVVSPAIGANGVQIASGDRKPLGVDQSTAKSRRVGRAQTRADGSHLDFHRLASFEEVRRGQRGVGIHRRGVYASVVVARARASSSDGRCASPSRCRDAEESVTSECELLCTFYTTTRGALVVPES